MIKVIVSVKDTVAEIFNDARMEVNIASALRAFNEAVKDSPHKDDYAMYQVGTFDTNTGVIIPNEPVRLCSGHDVKTPVSLGDIDNEALSAVI